MVWYDAAVTLYDVYAAKAKWLCAAIIIAGAVGRMIWKKRKILPDEMSDY